MKDSAVRLLRQLHHPDCPFHKEGLECKASKFFHSLWAFDISEIDTAGQEPLIYINAAISSVCKIRANQIAQTIVMEMSCEELRGLSISQKSR